MVCPYFIPEEPRIHREQEFFRSLLGFRFEVGRLAQKLSSEFLPIESGILCRVTRRTVVALIDDPLADE